MPKKTKPRKPRKPTAQEQIDALKKEIEDLRKAALPPPWLKDWPPEPQKPYPSPEPWSPSSPTYPGTPWYPENPWAPYVRD